MCLQLPSTEEGVIFLYHRYFCIFFPSKTRMTIVRNEIYFCTTRITNEIVLALRKRLLKV